MKGKSWLKVDWGDYKSYCDYRVWLFLLVLAITACGKKEVFLQTSELKRIDSLFITSRKEWTAQLADSCEAYREIYFQPMVDSLMEDRMEEIRRILEKHE